MKWDEWRGSLDGRPTMWIKRLLSFRGWCLDLHKFVAPDDWACFHTHPAHAWRFVFWNGYSEQLSDGSMVHIHPPYIGRVRPEHCHRISGLFNGGPSYSLWLRAPKCTEVELHGDGWAAQTTDGVAAGGEARPATAQEDRWLHGAVKVSSTLVAPGKLADGVATVAPAADQLLRAIVEAGEGGFVKLDWMSRFDGLKPEFKAALEAAKAHVSGVATVQGPTVLNALAVLERMDYKPGDRVLVENFLRVMGERGMWVIENPLMAAAGVVVPAEGQQ